MFPSVRQHSFPRVYVHSNQVPWRPVKLLHSLTSAPKKTFQSHLNSTQPPIPHTEMTTMQAWRKVYGSLKDQTTVGLAHVNSDFKEVDVAIVKATNHVECPPKERHIRKILAYTSSNRPRADVQYCLHALARRLAKTQNWTVALKTLIVIHRTLRDGDPTFREELLNFQQRGLDLQLANFKDDSSPVAWDCSAWVLTYGLFLEERLECYRVLKYDIEAEQIPRPAQGQDNMGYSRTRDLESEELLEQLPSLQQLLYRLVGCRPEGAAVGNYLIQYALALVLKESFKIYCAVNDGIINLIVKFFEMPRHEAIKALDIYKRAGQQAAHLSDFYDVCNRLVIARNFKVIVLRELPQSFLATMEEYIREPLWLVTSPTQPLEFPERLMLTYKPEEDNSPHEEDAASPVEQPKSVPTDDFIDPNDVPEPTQSPPAPTFNSRVPDDLLGLNFDALNGSALAIVPFDTTSSVSGFQTKDFDPTGWELALVSNPSTNISSVQNRQLETEMSGLTSISINRPSIQSSLSDRSKPDPESQARRISITTPPQPPSVPTGKQQIQKKPSVAEIERAIGAGMFKDRDINRESEQEKTLFDQNLSTSIGKTEGDVEKKLRDTGEWIIDQTEGPSRSTRMNILKVVFLWILSVWIILYLLVTFGLISINLDKLLSRGLFGRNHSTLRDRGRRVPSYPPQTLL